MKAYYKGLFKIKEVEVIAQEKYIDYFYIEPSFSYMYLIRFKNGRMKLVKSEKIIFE